VRRTRDTFERLRAANPQPEPVDPDWGRISERFAREHDEPAAAAARRPGRLPRRARGLLAAAALCLALAAGALIAIAPGSDGPGFLARAAAALTPPGAGSVLYERWEHVVEPEPGNPLRTHTRVLGPESLWIEGGAPRNYRAVLQPGPEPPGGFSAGGAALADIYGVDLGFSGAFNLPHGENRLLDYLQRRLSGGPLEIGGAVEPPGASAHPGGIPKTLTFIGDDRFLSARLKVTLGPTLPGPHDQIIEDGADPVAALRQAIEEHRAHQAGTTTVDGRRVLRIVLDLPDRLPADAPPFPRGAPIVRVAAFAFVEPGSFHPVEIDYGGAVYRFLAYDYLPATAGNLALADIRARHPRARVLSGAEALARPGAR
jgi:hypothetical protein